VFRHLCSFVLTGHSPPRRDRREAEGTRALRGRRRSGSASTGRTSPCLIIESMYEGCARDLCCGPASSPHSVRPLSPSAVSPRMLTTRLLRRTAFGGFQLSRVIFLSCSSSLTRSDSKVCSLTLPRARPPLQIPVVPCGAPARLVPSSRPLRSPLLHRPACQASQLRRYHLQAVLRFRTPKEGEWSEVTEQDVIDWTFTKVNTYKNFKCKPHNLFFELNL
jgi:hypothetical protein